MNLLFGLFRFLTWGNLISLGLLTLVLLLAGLVGMVMGNPGVMFPVLTYMLIFVTIIMHNIKCLQLQRMLKSPGSLAYPGISIQLILLSILAFIYGIFIVNLLVRLNFLTLNEVVQFFKIQEPSKETGYTKMDVARMFVILMNFLFGIHAAAIIINCVLSSFFLNKWKKDREQAENNEHFFDV